MPSLVSVAPVLPNATTRLATRTVSKDDHNTIEIRRIVNDFLTRCSICLEGTPLDVDFYNECKEIMLSDYLYCTGDVPTTLESWFRRYLSVGVIITTNAYGHIKDKPTRVYISLYTALMTSLDDVFETNVEHYSGFNERFVKGEPQEDLILDAVAKILLDASRYYGRLATNIIVTATLDFFTGLSVEMHARDMTFSEDFHDFAILCRNMTGIADAYAAFIFPREVPFVVYVKCLPDLKTFINYTNDVMSFYKEDRAEETDNLASILRQVHPSMTKHQVLQKIVDHTVGADVRTRKILAENQLALDAYEHFRKGYVMFHVSSGRYKLDELFSYNRLE